ncbi:hypothetical protein [Dysgonomonas macrotermitis]|uniref:Uncharacterized protein n=1 Tax=Dysgonomonas macrotermitis TaxID=1346286 RepID=A0A1M5DGJ1_9BACT|nr:hypothetical protein [Dysgonomonas macrotermitis]SHF65812.1 hypothetical protein SAMN05444362_108180 [Dysgonomonas macrotermitis]
MIDNGGIYQVKMLTRYTLISVFSFILAGISSIFLARGTFTTRPEVINQMYPDRYLIIGATILTPIFFICGWATYTYGRRFGKMTLPLILGMLSIPGFILFYLLWGLQACLAMINS